MSLARRGGCDHYSRSGALRYLNYSSRAERILLRNVIQIVNACGAVAQGADGRFAWNWAKSKTEAEQSAVKALGLSAPPFPDLGSAMPRAAHVVLSACTANV